MRASRSGAIESAERQTAAAIMTETRRHTLFTRSSLPGWAVIILSFYTSRMAARRGVWLVIVLIMFAVSLSALGMLLIFSAFGREPQVTGNSTLVLRIGGDLNEMEPGGVLGPFFEGRPTVRGVVEMLRKAKADKRITSVILKPTGSGALWGKVQEVRDAVTDFRRSGKPAIP